MKLNKTIEILNPQASIGKYRFYHYRDVPQNCNSGYVGIINNRTNNKIKIEIEIDNGYMYENKHSSCCFHMNIDNYLESEIIMTSSFYEEFKKAPELLPVIWHEIGHFHTLQYFPEAIKAGFGIVKNYRKGFISDKEIDPSEKVADLFATYYTSKEQMIKFFNYMIRRRRNNVEETEANKSIAVSELCRRKRFINELDGSKENIQKMIAELCGKETFDKV